MINITGSLSVAYMYLITRGLFLILGYGIGLAWCVVCATDWRPALVMAQCPKTRQKKGSRFIE
jgi:hypothetical protein